MDSYHLFLWLSVFVATVVEMVEALTIILALGVTRGWRSVLLATGAAILTLAVVLVVFNGVFATLYDETYFSIGPLWAIVGGLLLIFGLQWMKKAILRISGVLKSRDEDEIYEHTAKDAKKTPRSKHVIDWYSFVLAYKGVLLEGFEVIFIVVVFGVSRGEMGIGVSAAIAALLVVVALGLLIHKPLSRVPENLMKLTVGLLLAVFGTYFGAQGLGVVWPYGEWALLYLLVIYSLYCVIAIKLVRAGTPRHGELTP